MIFDDGFFQVKWSRNKKFGANLHVQKQAKTTRVHLAKGGRITLNNSVLRGIPNPLY